VSSVSSVGNAAAAAAVKLPPSPAPAAPAAPAPAAKGATPAALPPVKRAPDGDTVQQEAAETNAAKRAEKQNGGFAPKSGGVNKIA
jgi:hypothetical protein